VRTVARASASGSTNSISHTTSAAKITWTSKSGLANYNWTNGESSEKLMTFNQSQTLVETKI